MAKFLKLNPGLTFETIEYPDGGETLPVLQEAVGGLIATATGYFDLPKDFCAFVNDEGLLLDLDPIMIYEYVDRIWAQEGCNDPSYGYLAGNVVFTRTDDEGVTHSLTDQDISAIKRILGDMYVFEFGNHNLLFKSFCR